jgi:AcrR family transcriptional regulator
MSRTRKDAASRKDELLNAGYEIARDSGIRKVTRAAVARQCNVSDGLLNRYFDGREGLRSEVMAHAVAQKDVATLVECADHYELTGFGMPTRLASEVRAAQKMRE